MGDNCADTTFASCVAIRDDLPNLADGIFSVDPDGAGTGEPAFEVVCDMTLSEGGWTLVGQEREGDSGTFKFLGAQVGDPSAAAHQGSDALFGARFAGAYQEVRVDWSNKKGANGGLYFRTTEEMFANTVNTAMPVLDFWTNDPKLSGWMTSAGGAVLCRASRSPNVRPGDTSWALKPQDQPAGDCGCNGAAWAGFGAFYGGHTNATACTPYGGGWAGVVDDGQPKGNITWWATKIWIR